MTKMYTMQTSKSVKDKEDATAEEIRNAIDELMQKFQKVSEVMYQQAQQEAQQQAGSEETGKTASNDENVYDADFKEVDEDK